MGKREKSVSTVGMGKPTVISKVAEKTKKFFTSFLSRNKKK